MPQIILKKTFKTKPSGFQVANEKSFSVHGYVLKDVIDALNNQLKLIKFSGSKSSGSVTFKMDSYGHSLSIMSNKRILKKTRSLLYFIAWKRWDIILNSNTMQE
jgi:hypothetical protein